MKLFDLARPACAAVLIACAPVCAHAGRPMAADDAVILDPGACQIEGGLEALQQGGPRHGQLSLLPACRVGAWELAAGANLAQQRGEGGALLQAKTVFQALETGGWAIGLVLADQFATSASPVYTVNLPLSVSLGRDAVLVHLNAGGRISAGRTAATWALGTQVAAGAHGALTAETYGNAVDGASARVGGVLPILPGRLELDLSYSRRLGARSAAPTIAIGFTFYG
jgi:hypothetical protein